MQHPWLSRRNARKQGSKNLPNQYNRCGKNIVFSLDSWYAYRLKPNPCKVKFQIKEVMCESLRFFGWEATDKRVCPLIITSQHKTINVHNRISTQNSTPCMYEIRHLSVAFSTHTLFFVVSGITSDLQHSTNVGWRSDTPLCHIFDRFSFQSANQNYINHRKSDVLRPLKRQPSNG